MYRVTEFDKKEPIWQENCLPLSARLELSQVKFGVPALSLEGMLVTLILLSVLAIPSDWAVPGAIVIRRVGASSIRGEQVKLASSPSLTLRFSGINCTILSWRNRNIGELKKTNVARQALHTPFIQLVLNLSLGIGYEAVLYVHNKNLASPQLKCTQGKQI